MNNNSTQIEIQHLTKELLELEHKYYSGNSKVEDEVFDFKLRKLISLEEKYPNFALPNSPTKNIGKTQNNTTIKVKHDWPMLSIDNAFNHEEMEHFFQTAEKTNDNIEYFLEPKIDGASISLVYENNYLKCAISRGDGQIGEDLTEKVKKISNIPLKVFGGPGNFTIRGEIYITKTDFESIQQTSSIKFNNHRNYVSGSLRLKKSSELAGKKLQVVFYQLIINNQESVIKNQSNAQQTIFSMSQHEPNKTINIKKQSNTIEQLKQWKIPTHNQEKTFLSSNKKEIYNFIEKFKEEKEVWEVPTDGLVVKVNDFHMHDEIGSTSKFPKWATAYKYPSLVKETKLLDIVATVGRSGRITYVANLEPVEINGTIIQHTTLHNSDHIEKLNLKIGDIVQIYKSGEIIPQIIGYVDRKNRDQLKPFVPKTNCPCCGTILVIQSKKIQLCTNVECLDRKIAQLAHFSSRDCMNIEGLSTQIISKLLKLGFIEKPSDIYVLKDKKEALISANINLKTKLFNKLITGIENSKKNSQEKVLCALGINKVGQTISKLLLKKFKNIPKIFADDGIEIEKIYKVGSIVADEIIKWHNNTENQSLITDLIYLGIIRNDEDNTKTLQVGLLNDKSVVITGSFPISRDELVYILEERHGAVIKKSISKKIDYLIVGENYGSKYKDATTINIPILYLDDLKKFKII